MTANEVLERVHADFERFSRFKVFTLDRLLLPMLQHIQIASDQFEFVTDFFKFNGCIEILLINCLLLLPKQDLEFFAQFWIKLTLIYALNAQISRFE